MSMFSSLVQIRTLTLDQIRAAMTAALSSPSMADDIADYVALVDWSHSEQASADVKDILGPLMQASISYEEGDTDIDGLRQEVSEIIELFNPKRTPPTRGKLAATSAR